MFRIRRIADGFAPANAKALADVEQILTSQFFAPRRQDITGLAEKLARPGKRGMAPLVLIAEDASERVRGCILAYGFVSPPFLFLDYLATPPGRARWRRWAALPPSSRKAATAPRPWAATPRPSFPACSEPRPPSRRPRLYSARSRPQDDR